MARADEVNADLIDMLIARGTLWSAALIRAFRATPRHLFLDRVYHHHHGWRLIEPSTASDEDLRLVYADRAVTTRMSEGPVPVAISSSSQPSLMAQMLEEMELRSGQKVLEIGAGTGYNAALMAHVCGVVTAIDVDREVLADARRHLEKLPDRQVHLHHADGRLGFAPEAPYDRIMVTAAAAELESSWLAQMKENALLQVPLDLGPALAYLLVGRRTGGMVEGRLTRPAYFMPLRDEGDPGRDRNEPVGPVPPPDRLSRLGTPWRDWSERLEPQSWLPGLVFLGWLRGWTLGYATLPDGRTAHGLVDLVRGQAVWLGSNEWRVSGAGGETMGREIWREFLDLGGPHPPEWRARIGGEDNAVRARYQQRGMVWELPRKRRRPNWEE